MVGNRVMRNSGGRDCGFCLVFCDVIVIVIGC